MTEVREGIGRGQHTAPRFGGQEWFGAVPRLPPKGDTWVGTRLSGGSQGAAPPSAVPSFKHCEDFIWKTAWPRDSGAVDCVSGVGRWLCSPGGTE
jgi:hypothetical protein